MTKLLKTRERIVIKNLPQLGVVKVTNKKIKKKFEKPMTIEKLKDSLNSIESFIGNVTEEDNGFRKFEEIQNFNFLKLNLLSSSIKTSNNTLANVPKLTASELDKASESYEKELQKHSAGDKLELEFNQWKLELELGFNLILFGIGSKLGILNEFSSHMNDNGYHIIVASGNNTKLNLKSITQAWLINIIKLTTNFPIKLKDQLDFILDSYKEEKVVLIIHNLDQVKLNQYQLENLKRISNLANVHLVASVDKWDSQLLLNHKFNWIYHKLSNFKSYRMETKYLSLKSDNKLKLSLVGVQHVLNSVSEKAKRMFSILTSSEDDNNTDNNNNNSRIGMQYSDLFSKCKHKFLVSTEIQLNSLLKEFIDHGVIVQSQDTNSTTTLIHGFLSVPLNKDEITKLDL